MSTPHPGVLVRREITEHGLTVAEAAARLQVHRVTLTRLIGGISRMSASMALKLEAAGSLRTALDWMIVQVEFDLERSRNAEFQQLNVHKRLAD